MQCRPNSAEWQVWKKSLLCPGFPHRDVIDEFLIDKDKLPTRALAWKRPKIFHMMVINIHVLENVPLFTDCLGVLCCQIWNHFFLAAVSNYYSVKILTINLQLLN